MADEFEEGGKSGGGKMPTWIWLAAGGGLILILMLKGGNKQSSTATDNLLAAEIDANLKSLQENMDLQMKQYKDDQKVAWDDFKLSIEDLLRERQGTEPPTGSQPYTPPTSPGAGELPPYLRTHPAPGDKPASIGSESVGFIPDAVRGSVMDNYIMGFDYKRAKGGNL